MPHIPDNQATGGYTGRQPLKPAGKPQKDPFIRTLSIHRHQVSVERVCELLEIPEEYRRNMGTQAVGLLEDENVRT